jgi:hypothetical protein
MTSKERTSLTQNAELSHRAGHLEKRQKDCAHRGAF